MKKIFYLILGILFMLQISLPGQTVGIFYNDSLAFNGYTLFAPMRSTMTYLIDNCGNLVKSWESAYLPAMSVYLLENGNLLRTGSVYNPNFAGAAGNGGVLEIFDWNGNLTWQYFYYGENFQPHHDIEPLPNGNILVLCYDAYTPAEAIAAGRNPINLQESLWAEKIVEIEPIGNDDANIVWEWRIWDHLIQDQNQNEDNFGIIADHPELIDINYSASSGPNANTDWIHGNSISYNNTLDQIILSSRNLSEIYILDHSTTTVEAEGHSGGIYGKGGDLLYRYGNPISYDRGTANDQKIFFQHDAEWIPSGFFDGGKIMVFNNQSGAQTSTVDVFTPPQDSLGFYSDPGLEHYGPDSFDWSYSDPELFSKNISSAQRLANGNTLICEGETGNFIEITYQKQKVWKYVNPVNSMGPIIQGNTAFGNMVFRIKRFSPDFTGFEGKELISGDPIEINPISGICDVYDSSVNEVNLKVFLEGPYEISGMQNNLNSMDMIPLSQPFLTSPWNYLGPTTVDQIPNDQIVDWVLVDFRDAMSAEDATFSTSVSRQVGFLLSDGSVVAMDGASNLKFYKKIYQNLFVAIFHRNHIGIISANPLNKQNEIYTYDFSTSLNQVLGGSSCYKELSPGVWGMISGDADANGIVTEPDIQSFWNEEVGTQGYLPTDFNMDIQVDNVDKNAYCLPNIGISSQVPQ